MSKTKSVWESRFYVLKHKLQMHLQSVSDNLAKEAIEAGGKELNTIIYWEYIGHHKALKDLIKQAEYIETQMYF